MKLVETVAEVLIDLLHLVRSALNTFQYCTTVFKWNMLYVKIVNQSVPIQLAQCRFHWLVISNAKI